MKIPEYSKLLFLQIQYFYGFIRRQNWSSNKLKAYQNHKIKEIVNYAGNYVPYYRNLFSKIGLDIKEFRGLEDLNKLPYLDKETLRSNREDFLSDEFDKLDVLNVYTSGSTGTPLMIAQDKYSRAAKYASTLRAMNWAGYKLGCKWFSLWGVYATTKPTAYGIDKQLNKLYYSNNLMTEENNIEVGKLLNKFKPRFFSGYALSFLELGKTLRKNGINIHSPKGIMVYGGWLPEELRKDIEDLYNAPVYDFYSHSENTVMINERFRAQKMFVEDYFYPEFIRYDKEYNMGELVGTSFYNYAMPLIRYKTRDIIEFDHNKESIYGFRKITTILGRDDDYLLMQDGRKVLSSQRAIYGINWIKACQYIQDYYDHITINIIPDENFNPSDYGIIRERMKEITKTDIKVDFKLVDSLPKNEFGKSRFIIRDNKLNKS